MKNIILFILIILSQSVYAADQYKVNNYTFKQDIAGPIGLYGANGNVGINTLAPSCQLDVGTGGNICIGGVPLTSGGGSGNVGIGTTGRLIVQIGTTTTGTPYSLNTDSNGNLGINTLSPGTKLDVIGTIRATGFITKGNITFADGTSQTTAASAGTNFWNNGTYGISTTAANVGIGTTTPQSALIVYPGNIGIGTWTTTNYLTIANNTAASGIDLMKYSSSIGGIDGNALDIISMSGTNGSTTFNDTAPSPPGATWTANGDAKISNDHTLFGQNTGKFDGSGDYIAGTDSVSYATGTGSFTFDWDEWIVTDNTNGTIWGQASDGNNEITIRHSDNAAGDLTMEVTSGASLILDVTTPGSTFSTGSWHHVAFQRSCATASTACWDVWLDGINISVSSAGGSLGGSVPNIAAAPRIGIRGFNTALPFTGYIANFRFSTIARYTHGVNFAPPLGPYDNGTDTSKQSIRLGENGNNRFAVGYNGPLGNFEVAPGTIGTNTRMSINSSGNVGIGTTNPGVLLDISGGRMRTVGIGTTVPQGACIKSDGTSGYYTTATFAGTCL